MRDVTLVEVHADGQHLVLTDESGQQYRLPIDDQLRAAARNDLAWLNRLQLGSEQPLRPRDIQARIRAGLSAEEIAEATGMSLEHVRRYEGPVLAEREHVADTAQRVAVSRSGKGDTTLAESVQERLAVRGAEPATVWDSWREDAGSWIVQVGFAAGGRSRVAQWRYHQADATLEPIDDESRWLTVAPEPERTTPGVTERVYDVADGALHEQTAETPQLRSDPDGTRTLEEDPQARTLDLLDALRGRRGRRQPTETVEQPDLVDALLAEDEMLPPPAHPPASQPAEAVDAAILSLRDPKSAAADEPTTEVSVRESHPDDAAEPTRRPRKRATVPSWDDIMFGAKRD